MSSRTIIHHITVRYRQGRRVVQGKLTRRLNSTKLSARHIRISV